MKVHKVHRYPIHRPDDACAWLSPDGEVGAWVAEVNGDVAGHVCLTAEDGAPAPLMVSRLFVDPAAGRRGVGKLLLEHVIEVADRQGVSLALEVTDNSRAAIAFYVRAGWREAGRRPVRWASDVADHMVIFTAPPRPR